MARLKIKKRVFNKLVILIVIGIAVFLFSKLVFIKSDTVNYIKSNSSKVSVYDFELKEKVEIPRGSKVFLSTKKVEKDNNEYFKITYDDKNYYILKDNVTEKETECVEEKTMYVRTPVTVYVDNNTPDILGFLPKSSELEIVGYDTLKSDGTVNMYMVKYNDKTGYVYSKYLESTLELASANYNVDGIYDKHKDRSFYMELYGGSTANLDYYPYEKVEFKDNVMPSNTKTLYLNSGSDTLSIIDDYIEVAKNAGINAFVVDIKDGALAYTSEVAKKYSSSSYNSTNRTKEEYKAVIDKLKDNGFYVIGRIVAFNDSLYASDNLSDCIITGGGSNTKWVSPYSRKAWQYNVELALEAIDWFGFNEIQYDYVRFSESSYTWSKNGYNFQNTYNEEKAQAVQNFLLYATDQIHKKSTYISADVFGECANTYVTAYGQYWPAISNVVDVISAMPYPDHFNKYEYGFSEPVWTIPYKLLSKWGSSAYERQMEVKTPAKVRTWIQAYDAIHEPYVEYNVELVSQQISALYDAGLKDGFITWNAASSINKYRKLTDAFKKEY